MANVLSSAILDNKHRLEVNFSVLLALALVSIMGAMMLPANPAIIATLGKVELYPLSWSLFFVFMTIVMPIAGKLSDLFGRKPLFSLGIILFVSGITLCGLAPTMEIFIVARIIQGAGLGLIFSTGLVIIGEVNPQEKQGWWFGMFGLVSGDISAVFPILGGYVVQYLGWRWIFFITIPLGIVTLLYFIKVMPNVKSSNKIVIDYKGAILLSITAMALITAIGGGIPFVAWASATNLAILGAVTLLGFILVELKAEEPIMPLDLFKSPMFVLAIICVFFATAGLYPANGYEAFLAAGLKGLPASLNGFVLGVRPAALAIGCLVFGAMVAKTGRLKEFTLIGSIIFAVGLFALSTVNSGTPMWFIIVGLAAVGLGAGPSYIAFTMLVQSVLPVNKIGVGTGVITFFQNIGGTVGLAISGLVFTKTWMKGVAGAVPAQLQQGLPVEKLNGLLNPQILMDQVTIQTARASIPPELVGPFNSLVEGLKGALTTTMHNIWLIMAVMVVISVSFTIFVKNPPRSSTVAAHLAPEIKESTGI